MQDENLEEACHCDIPTNDASMDGADNDWTYQSLLDEELDEPD